MHPRTPKRRLSSAHVLAVIALVCSLGGTAWATAQITGRDIKNGTVTGADIKNGSLTGADVKDGSLSGADVKDGSLSGADVQNASLTGADIADGSVTALDLSTGARQVSTNLIAPGATLRGVFVANQSDPSANGLITLATAITYGGFQMPAPLAGNIIGTADPSTTACPGTAAAPEAAPGNLCIYLTNVQGQGSVDIVDPSTSSGDGVLYNVGTQMTSVIGTGMVGVFGVELFGGNATGSLAHNIAGSWAATAPTGA
jgi:hypothetical protein